MAACLGAWHSGRLSIPTSPEITAAAKALQSYEGDDFKGAAKAALEAAESKRDSQAKWTAVGRLHLPNGEWHNFAVAPFSTPLQAQRAGEGFTHDSKSGTGEGMFRVVPIVNKAIEAWNAIRPDQVDHKDWIKDQIENTLTGLSDPNVYKERGKW
jgi:hypothetical protein